MIDILFVPGFGSENILLLLLVISINLVYAAYRIYIIAHLPSFHRIFRIHLCYFGFLPLNSVPQMAEHFGKNKFKVDYIV